MAPRKRALRADEDTSDSQPAAKRQETPHSGSGTRSKQPTASHGSRTVEDSAQVAAATTTDPVQTRNSTTSESRPFSEDHVIKSQQQPQQESVRPRPKIRLKLRSRTSVALKSKPEAPGLLSIPLELQQKICMYTTARDTSRLRRVCKSLNWIVSGSSKYLAKQFANRELARLRHVVNEWTSLKMPTDLDSLMEALHVWTKRRGMLPRHTYAGFESMRKLMAHLFVRKKTGEDLHYSATEWSLIAAVAIDLNQQRVNKEVFDDESIFTCMASGLLDYIDCDRLLSLYYHTERLELDGQQRRLSGCLWPSGTLEHTTLPELRMTPLLDFERVSARRPLPDEDYGRASWLYEDYLDDENTNEPLEATHGSPALLQHLGLPELPNEVSCYHLKDEWAGREVERIISPLPGSTRSRPTRVHPMLRAALLENVMFF
jgi:hypothetical protein